ncbi:response regulator transcription factor [Asticcacaulis endophyticus]|uniref:response regulator transcription factor n=1 Tax=Asticcacaulis endophyticus TaxID=1395890 RepID=UPI001679F768|nr:helix-turn-helix transcriptional regulator [Asticcacaulis endophyticus]
MASRKIGVDALTDRQKEILKLISQGYQQKEIANKLGLEISTIKGHAEEARFKLSASTTRIAARIYVNHTPLQKAGGAQSTIEITNAHSHTNSHEHANLYIERTQPHHNEVRSFESHSGSDAIIQAQRSHLNGGSRIHRDEERGGGISRFPSSIWVDGLGELRRWIAGLIRRLKTSSPTHWLASILVLAILIPVVAALLMGAAMVVLQGIYEIKSSIGPSNPPSLDSTQ